MRRTRERRADLEATVSDDAALLARTTRALRVPFPLPSSLIPPLLRAIRRHIVKVEAPFIAAVRDRLIRDVTHHDFAGIPVLEITPYNLAENSRRAGDCAVYLHGGAYILGTANDSLGLLMADELRMPVFSIDYELAPDAVFPTALDQVVRAYANLVKNRQCRTILFGVSAGGGLALSLVNRLHRVDLPQPRAIGLFTPWVDLTGAGDSYLSNEGRDRAIRWQHQLERAASAYAGATSRSEPGISPIYDDYPSDYPPTMITTGTRDLLLSDCVRLYWKLHGAGANTELRVWEGMWHALPGVPDMPEAQQCRAEVGAFLRAALHAEKETGRSFSSG